MDQIVHRFRKGLWGPDSEVLGTYVFLPISASLEL